MKSQQILKQIMATYNVNCIQVASMIGVKPNTVRVWRTQNGASIPATKLELLQLKLKSMEVENV